MITRPQIIEKCFQQLVGAFDKNGVCALDAQVNGLSTKILDHPHSLEWLKSRRAAVAACRDLMTQKIGVYNDIIKNYKNNQACEQKSRLDFQITVMIKCCLSIFNAQALRNKCHAVLTNIDSQIKTV